MNTNKLIAEFLGTFTLCFIGISAICNDATLVGVALAHGLALVVMITAMGHISGGHYNPAVTVGALVGGKIKGQDAVGYIFAQLFGGFVGALAAKAIFATSVWQSHGLGTPMLGAGVEVGTGILLEVIMTFFLVLAVYGTAIDKRAPKLGGLLIGLTVTMDILAGGPISGASMNPARTFGPALAGGFWDNHIVYWIGPMLGGALAGFLYSKVLAKEGM